MPLLFCSSSSDVFLFVSVICDEWVFSLLICFKGLLAVIICLPVHTVKSLQQILKIEAEKLLLFDKRDVNRDAVRQ